MPEPDTLKNKQFAATLARGIGLLRAFGPADPVLGNGELAARLGLDRATVSRLTHTLVRLNLLDRDRSLRKYRIAPGILTLGYPLLASSRVRQFARPYMRELATAVHGSVGIGIRHQTEMIYLDAVVDYDGPNPMIDRGMPIPLLTSSMGNAWLGFATPNERDQALNQLRVRSPGLYADSAHLASRAVRTLHEHGYCWRLGLRLRDRFNVAAPFRWRVEGQIMVFNCTVPMDGPASPQERAADLGPQLLAMLRKVESASGADRI